MGHFHKFLELTASNGSVLLYLLNLAHKLAVTPVALSIYWIIVKFEHLCFSHKITIQTFAAYDQRKSYRLYHRRPSNLQLPDSSVCTKHCAESAAADCRTVRIKADLLFSLPQSGKQKFYLSANNQFWPSSFFC